MAPIIRCVSAAERNTATTGNGCGGQRQSLLHPNLVSFKFATNGQLERMQNCSRALEFQRFRAEEESSIHKATVEDGRKRLDMHAQADGFIGQVISLAVVGARNVRDRKVKRAG